jgi:hypothetical protein
MAGTGAVDLSSLPPAARKKLATGILERAKAERRRRLAIQPYAVATALLRDAKPEELAEDYHLVRAAYDAYPSAWLDLARAHPAPYVEYAIRDDKPNSPTHGQRIHLGKMHLEMIQILLHHRLCCAVSSAEHGATTIVLGMTEWMLGKNQDYRVKVLGENDDGPRKRVTRLRNRISGTAELRRVFPRLRPSKADQWTMGKFYVSRSGDSQEPSVEGRGILAPGTGTRTDIAVYDDVVGKTNALRNPAKKPQVKTSFFSDWFGTGATGIHWYIANFWAPDDLTQHLRRLAETGSESFTPERRQLPSGGHVVHGRDWTYLEHAVKRGTNISPWAERWTEEAIATVRRITPPPDMARRWECRRPTAGEEQIQPEWIRYAPAPPIDKMDTIIQFGDTASGEGQGAAYTGEMCAGIYRIQDLPVVHFFFQDHYRLKMTARVDRYSKNLVRFRVTYPLIENKHDGKTQADMVEDKTGRVVERPTPTDGKTSRMVRWIPMFRSGRVFFTPDMNPDEIAMKNDPEAANVVAEILGTASTMDLHDCAEGILDKAAQIYVFGEQELPIYIPGITDRETPAKEDRKPGEPEVHPLLKAPPVPAEERRDDDDPFNDWSADPDSTVIL